MKALIDDTLREGAVAATIKWSAALLACAITYAVGGCTPQPSPKPAPEPQAAPATSPSPAAALDKALLTDDEVNAIVDQTQPAAPGEIPLHFRSFGPIAHEPDTPASDSPNPMPAPCDQVLPAYFGAGDPPFSSYASLSMGGIYNTSFKELIVRYSTASQANEKFSELTANLPGCADAAAQQPSAWMTLNVDTITADSVRFHTELVGEVRERTNTNVINDEYRLVGNAIIGASSTNLTDIVTTAVDQLRGRIRG